MAMHPSFRQIAPDLLEIREGGGCLALFGLPFLLAGLFVVLIGLRLIPVQNAADLPAWAWPLLLLLGLVFVVVGGGMVFGRRWILLDVGRGRFGERWGLLVPLRKTEQALRDFDAVALRFQAGDSDSADSFPVVLRAVGGGSDRRVFTSTAYEASRQAAAQVARFLRLPMVDASTQHESILPAEHADASLQERLRGEHGGVERPPRPLSMRSQVRETAGTVQIVIPGPGFRVAPLLGIVIPGTILGLVVPSLLRFFEQTGTPQAVQFAFLGFLVLVFGLLPALSGLRALVAGIRGQTLLTATAEALILEERGAWRTRVARIPTVDILDMDYGTAGSVQEAARRAAEQQVAEAGARVSAGTRDRTQRWATRVASLAPSKGITLKTRSGLFTVGAGLPDEEIRYLYALIRQGLAGEEGARW